MIRRLVWNATHGRRNPGWKARLAEIRVLGALDAPALSAWQEQQVAAHLRWARARLPHFRSRAPASDDLQRWPVLRRADVQAGLEGLVDPERDPTERLPDSSGGSTGEPVRFFHDREYWAWTLAQEVAFYEWWGIDPWAPTAYLWGADRDLRAPWKARLEMWLLGRVQLNVFRVDERRLEDFAHGCEGLAPVVLQGYASALDLFAHFVARRGPLRWRPRVIRSAAETLRAEVRERLERVFGAPVRDIYGSRETAGIAAECAQGRLHVLAHGKVVEIVDEAGRACAPGVPGRVLVTDLTNRAFGFIRYENGDVASWAPTRSCACGIGYPILERVHGRTSDFLSTPDGRRVHGEYFTHLFYGRDDVERFQVRQQTLEAVEVLTVGTIGEAQMQPLLAAMREQLGQGVRVTWRRVADIDAGPTGKHRFTVSAVPYLPAERA